MGGRPQTIDLSSKTVLITGGTGSFGREFVRALLHGNCPQRLVIFSRDEFKQFEMQQQLSSERYPCLRYFIGDVRDRERLEMAFRDVDYVIHAAALKHVPAAEYNPTECIHTNVMGAENVVQAALRCNVQKVIALSTDKAVNPINLYGASKLASDKIFVAANHLSGRSGTRFSVVRYGNVLGSRGSVIPLFHQLIAGNADSLPITDERMTRFWITLSQGIDLVLSSLQIMQGGEIFVAKVPSMKIVDLARAMAPHLPNRVVGIRPGEKLHEIMITADDARNTFELADRYVIAPSFHFWNAGMTPIANARPVAEDFIYTSNGNTEWLDAAALRKLLELSGFVGPQ